MEFKYIRASFVKRFLGYIPDMLVFETLLGILLSHIIGTNLEYFPITFNAFITQIPITYYPLQFAIQYPIELLIWTYVWVRFEGKSIGKYFLKTRIVAYPSLDIINKKQALFRFIIMDISVMIAIFVLIDIWFRTKTPYSELIPWLIEVGTLTILILPLYIKDKRPWHDIIAGTCVIDEKKVKEQEIQR